MAYRLSGRMPQWKKRKAKRMAKNQTPPEKMLWAKLRDKQLGVWFYKQKPMCGYTVDFWCPKAGLVIEVDGKCHEIRKAYDARRDAVLRAKGIETMRFTALEVRTNLPAVVVLIRDGIERRRA